MKVRLKALATSSDFRRLLPIQKHAETEPRVMKKSCGCFDSARKNAMNSTTTAAAAAATSSPAAAAAWDP